jgi:hypothetical protein
LRKKETKTKESETERTMAVAQKQRDCPPISSLMVPDLDYEFLLLKPRKKRGGLPMTKEMLFQKETSGPGFNTTAAKQVRITCRCPFLFLFFPVLDAFFGCWVFGFFAPK